MRIKFEPCLLTDAERRRLRSLIRLRLGSSVATLDRACVFLENEAAGDVRGQLVLEGGQMGPPVMKEGRGEDVFELFDDLAARATRTLRLRMASIRRFA